MSEYWKSQPRKFCDFCKCWITDNKPSVEFHEKGKKHLENVQIRLAEIRKKGQKDYKAKQEMDEDMRRIEEAALKAYQKDLQSSSSSTPATITETKVWYEGRSDEGHTYYWNSVTSESRWEPPDEPYVSLKEQQTTDSEKKNTDEKTKDKKSKKDKKSSKKKEEEPLEFGPQMKNDPYGHWETVDDSVPEPVELDLPPQQEFVAVVVPVDEPKFKFQERKVATLAEADTEEGAGVFKKRKFNNSNFKRSIRTKTDDD